MQFSLHFFYCVHMDFSSLTNALAKNGEVAFRIKVRPGANKSQIKEMMEDGTWKIDIAAIPEDGKANAELIRFLSKEFSVPKQNIVILSGHTSTQKAVRVQR